MISTIITTLCISVMAALVGGSLLNLTSNSHWFVRGWDFPRTQIVGLSLVITAIYAVNMGFTRTIGTTTDVVMATSCVFLLVWHGIRIFPYTALARRQSLPTEHVNDDRSIRLVVSNLLQDNKKHDLWLRTIRDVAPDIVIALEVNQRWASVIETLSDMLPHRIMCPQENCYGMVLASRFKITSHEIRHLVQSDIPSIDAKIQIESGEQIRVVGIHPRPPEPVRDQDSVPRDAELLLHAEELREEMMPVIVGGDLNDVAWSRTTRLFLQISNLLDPRRGRGFFNTFHAQHAWFRFPLDHIFHSRHFTLREIRRLPEVGSDHFPILIQLQLEPEKKQQQPAMTDTSEDREEADELIERARQDESSTAM
ncbi:endonuclease/exonuclease/phosphatase [Rhodopirellula maiorica SM1]|uniref:Endonuclease/exonuclease/phosphatase n=1 Tax=Rhodopirellula maiorica SM1 TaxID=1265738 RepID=M5R9M9_9BACT|nr:endonuclease/exonuclease/phosphatase family protein [Rhodopirellula maiorica]EMI15751.1 endonuclease/exonuclease/phosphatase [Rhodopirellula maiorica SM1]